MQVYALPMDHREVAELQGTAMRCLRVCPDPGFGFGVGVLVSGVGGDGASVRQLDFRVQYLAIGRGRVTGRDSKAVDLDGGDAHE